MSKTKSNPGLGRAFYFFGKFRSKILAARSEREHPGSFILKRDGYWYVLKSKVRTRTRKNPEFDNIYLDDMDINELWDFWSKTNSVRPIRFARELFPSQPKGYVETTKNLGHYAANRATAMRLRLEGNITTAMEYEKIAERIYNKLPSYAHWNPRKKKSRHIKNPSKDILIYGRVLKIFAQKTEGPYKGQRFVHTFKKGAQMLGMPDGSIRIVRP